MLKKTYGPDNDDLNGEWGRKTSLREKLQNKYTLQATPDLVIDSLGQSCCTNSIAFHARPHAYQETEL